MTPIDWLLNGETGVSSKTICAVMTGSVAHYNDVPHDPSDFGRCYKLLALFPEWRARLHEVAEKFPMWGPMVEAWDELTALYEEETKSKSGKAPKLYDRMQVLIDEGRIAAGWMKTGPGCWRGPGVDVVSLGKGASVSFGR
jgi:hypothetical protein